MKAFDPTSLEMTAFSSDFKLVRQLLQTQQYNLVDLNQALLAACSGERDAPEIAALLIAYGAEVNCKHNDGSTLLHIAASEG